MGRSCVVPNCNSRVRLRLTIDSRLQRCMWLNDELQKTASISESPTNTRVARPISNLAKQALQIQALAVHTSAVTCNVQRTEKTINQVTLLGRVGADPQKRGSEEHPVINFPLATHFSYKYESGDVLQRTDWHRVSVFKPGLRDTIYRYLKKGQRVYVTGKLSYGEVKLDDGQVRTASTIIADDIIFFQSQPQENE